MNATTCPDGKARHAYISIQIGFRAFSRAIPLRSHSATSPGGSFKLLYFLYANCAPFRGQSRFSSPGLVGTEGQKVQAKSRLVKAGQKHTKILSISMLHPFRRKRSPAKSRHFARRVKAPALAKPALVYAPIIPVGMRKLPTNPVKASQAKSSQVKARSTRHFNLVPK
jgi:hypothetical protein